MGPGGCSKTRLALQVASELINVFPEGVWLVSLADVSDSDLVPLHILTALHRESAPDQTPLSALIAYLQNKQLLLLLDNCEQLQAAAITHTISEILAAALGVKILVTSRFRLHLYGEFEFNVPLFDFPPPDAKPDAAAFIKYAAVRLFVERAQALLPHFVLNNENAAMVAQICARVDGLPLALELAAARVKVLSLPLLLEKLSNARLSVLTGGAKDLPERQRTLRNTIDWSYNLLSSPEQTWFRWLGIFPQDVSLERIEILMQSFAKNEEYAFASESLLDILEHLVNCSLLLRVATTDHQVRFVMLETLREYALEKLHDHNELDKLRERTFC